jgi:hypothetical protein
VDRASQLPFRTSNHEHPAQRTTQPPEPPHPVLLPSGEKGRKLRCTSFQQTPHLAGNSLFERENAKIAPGLDKLYAGTRPATMRRYGETDEVI